MVLLLLFVVLVVVVSFGIRSGFGVGFWVGVRFQVEEDLLLEVPGHRCLVGGAFGVLLGCLGRLCGGRGASGSLACGCSFCFGRGFWGTRVALSCGRFFF